MPLYEFRCEACEIEWEGLARWETAVSCACGGPATRLISAPTVRLDLTPYYDDGLGARVDSRAHRRQLMQAHSLVENDAPVRPHGTRGTVFSFPGRTTASVPPSGAFVKKRDRG